MKYIETIKTVVIAMLVAGILSFVAGMHYANQQSAKLDAARSQVTQSK